MVIDGRGVHMPGLEVTDRGIGGGRGRRGAGVTLVRNGVTARMSCRGGAASIAGDRNRLTLVDCSRLSVPGNDNEISVALVGAAVIDVPGNRDRVTYTTPPGVRARVSALGTGVRVTPGR